MPENICAEIEPSSTAGVLLQMVSLDIDSCRRLTLKARNGDLKFFLSKVDAGVLEYCVVCLNVFLIILQTFS